MSINKSTLLGKMDNSINKLEALGIPKHLLNEFARLKSLRNKLDIFDENEDTDIIKIISDKFTVLVNKITQEAIKSFNDFATTSVNDIKQATGGTGRAVRSVGSSESAGRRSGESSGRTVSSGESSGRIASSGESNTRRSSESNSVRTSSSESSSRRSSESNTTNRSSGESGGFRGRTSSN